MNILIVGAGSKFGSELYQKLEHNNNVFGISGSKNQNNFLTVDWEKCQFTDFEKWLKQLPKLNLVVFNQNYKSLHINYFSYREHIAKTWQQERNWQQGHFVNCILPLHILHSLHHYQNLDSEAKICFMLSKTVINLDYPVIPDYRGQKYQNLMTLKELAKNDTRTYIGLCPGELDNKVYVSKADIISKFLLQDNLVSSLFYDTTDNGVIPLNI